MIRTFPRPRSREPRITRNDVQVIRCKVTQQVREVCHGKSWDERRREVWNRDGRRCLDCGKQVPLHDLTDTVGYVMAKAAEIHHWVKRKMGGSQRDDRKENLGTLCFECHGVRTRRGE